MISRAQLLGLGYSAAAIRSRVSTGRLHPIHRGVYAVGRPELADRGRWMAAVLAGGDGAALSHASAAALWAITTSIPGAISISVPLGRVRRVAGLEIHRRGAVVMGEAVTHDGIRVTSPTCTLVDLAATWDRDSVEDAVNAADRLDLIRADTLRVRLERLPGVPGVMALREILDRRTFTLTDSQLERRLRPIARRAGLRPPLTQQWVNGFRVDFLWPELGLLVETDGLRYHRTASQQARDLRREQIHTAAGLTPLRFSRAQVRYEPEHVVAILAAARRRLAAE